MREADVLVVGAGPAGLHAALKAAILNHTVLLVDKGRRFSRVSQAPAIANIPGHPGISGPRLLEQGRADLARFADVSGKRLVAIEEDAEVVELARARDGRFHARVHQRDGAWDALARVVVLATGVVDRKPGIAQFEGKGHETMAPYISRERVGYCLLCEGWTLDGKRVAVVGHTRDALSIARDVADQFGGRVTLLSDGHEPPAHAPPEVALERRRISALRQDGGLVVTFEDGDEARFDRALFGLGWHRANNALARMLGARIDPDGHVVTDENREVLDERGAPIRGLFAVGDVRAGPWKQIPLAWADAELAILAAYAHRLPDATPAR